MRVAYIRRAHPAYPRSTKECNALVRAGHRVTFVGWDFKPEEKRQHEMDPEVGVALLRVGSEYGRFEIVKWVRWYAHILKTLGFRRYDVVHCVDEYPTVMVLPFKRLLFRRIVMDVFDSIIKRPAKCQWRRSFYRLVRWFANSGSDLIIETSEELQATLGRFARKAIVVMNSPDDPWETIRHIEPPTSGPLKVAVGGGIGRKRMALDTLLRVLDELGPARVQVLSSGLLTDDFARKDYAKHPCVTHRWLDSNAEYFAQLAECHLVYGVRGDAEDSEYRRLVFPQKVFDAMAVGRPIVVARENWIGEWLVSKQLGYSCSFRDANAMKNVFVQCASQRAQSQAFANRARSLFRQRYEWPVMADVMLKAYERLQ